MTSVLMTPDGRTVEAEAAHGTVTATSASTSRARRPPPIRSHRSSPGPAPAARGRMDDTPEVSLFAHLERVCVETVESGSMTKDLALLVGGDQGFLTTEEFLASIDENLEREMKQWHPPHQDHRHRPPGRSATRSCSDRRRRDARRRHLNLQAARDPGRHQGGRGHGDGARRLRLPAAGGSTSTTSRGRRSTAATSPC